eukprot:Phypoly_transcript_09720.p1 GENE.Phypoly_transcript_09720~~Phypoly_transcript_09720.p1  ORF type:complete len:110 (+),score=9.42 Phypoly_transcript_09720:1001-1330(+)
MKMSNRTHTREIAIAWGDRDGESIGYDRECREQIWPGKQNGIAQTVKIRIPPHRNFNVPLSTATNDFLFYLITVCCSSNRALVIPSGQVVVHILHVHYFSSTTMAIIGS